MIDDKDCVQLCEYLFNVCDALKIATRGKDIYGPDESERVALEYLKNCADCVPATLFTDNYSRLRLIRKVQWTVKRKASTPYAEYKEEVDGCKLGIQRILGALYEPSSPLDENLSAGDRPPYLAPVDTATVTIPVSESGASAVPPTPTLYSILSTPWFVLPRIQRFSLWTFDQARFHPT